ncbi:Crp/Fnr family transcriptional regulator [Ammoniphilus sp. CFH 90114]|uniref:Crp/Fnr family transcriptional regulator n=1 Tax=Ammoniphilus sp. CFH 90114 TaxID=2493665 RepID=UPI00100DFCDD|nr:Crp/Fnr family transcriptional regulator [Ammoniphilus sp. CFH 90114]RXT08032.1 Crp/Fnr family transcriptional regulator [Ammoniphilus sp. CFH 90114]
MNSLQFQWEPYIRFGEERRLKKNNILFRQGETGRGFYYLYDGMVNVKILSSKGTERIVDYIPSGFLLGEQGIQEVPYFSTVVLDVDSLLYYFSFEAFHRLCKEHPEAGEIFMNSLIYKVRLLAETVTLLNSPPEYQMAHFLFKLHQKLNRTDLPINQTALARYIGTSRITVYKILQQWLKDDMIEISNQTILLKDIKKIKYILNLETPDNTKLPSI